ncbi:MAG TPA: phosphohistidine phosphatase SixA [Bryobacteraceae bacterium]|nr:phosphohistidine phosphatase SixA [Bryobacteraceae bacterium]
MELYLLRHGIAEDHSATGRDADRSLTEEGREKLKRVLKRAASAGVEPSLILSSPYKRALETAEIAASLLGYTREILNVSSLKPHSSPPAVWSDIRDHLDQPSILLAGHEPLFSATVAWLLGSTRAMMEFKKGALVRIDIPGPSPQGVLQWMITAKIS